jgi:hypothetical protein
LEKNLTELERRDYILDEIYKFGQMVLGLIGKLKARQKSEHYDFTWSMADQEFEGEAGFSLRMLTEMNPESLQAFCKNHRELNTQNLELLSDLLVDLSDDPGCNTRMFLKTAGDLLEIATQKDKTFSIERTGKADFISARLASLGLSRQ